MAAFESAGEEGLSGRLEGVSVAGREFVHAVGEGHTLNAVVGVQRDVFGEHAWRVRSMVKVARAMLGLSCPRPTGLHGQKRVPFSRCQRGGMLHPRRFRIRR